MAASFQNRLHLLFYYTSNPSFGNRNRTILPAYGKLPFLRKNPLQFTHFLV